jgi:hypothetical protein
MPAARERSVETGATRDVGLSMLLDACYEGMVSGARCNEGHEVYLRMPAARERSQETGSARDARIYRLGMWIVVHSCAKCSWEC